MQNGHFVSRRSSTNIALERGTTVRVHSVKACNCYDDTDKTYIFGANLNRQELWLG